MTLVATIPSYFSDDRELSSLPERLGTLDAPILTPIIPAPRGCNLNCPFCYIDKRNEAARALDLTPADYIAFIDQVAAQENIGAICLQGYEPLLPESFVYTRAILEAGKRHGIPTSLVTNGTYLERWVDELAELRPDSIMVSIDSADPAIYDKARGKIGAFEDAMRGLRLAAADTRLQPVLTLASILMPQKHERLRGMPALTAELGIKHWVIKVLNDVSVEEIGGPVGDRRRTFADLVTLKREADSYGIDMLIEDALDKASRRWENVRLKLEEICRRLKEIKGQYSKEFNLIIPSPPIFSRGGTSCFKVLFLVDWGSAVFDIADDVCAFLSGQTSNRGRYHHVGSSVFSGMVGQTP
jgi:MoaA/NifB/PqqE/SkfB family radical SAM enzyme